LDDFVLGETDILENRSGKTGSREKELESFCSTSNLKHVERRAA